MTGTYALNPQGLGDRVPKPNRGDKVAGQLVGHNRWPTTRFPKALDWEKGCGQNGSMNRDQVIATLRAHEPALRDAGIVRLALFGSTSRGDQGSASDVDLLAAFDDTRRISILDIAGMELDLAGMLGCKVDLAEEGTLKPRVQQSVETEAVRAF